MFTFAIRTVHHGRFKRSAEFLDRTAISEGLRQENDNIRLTIISPGVTESELADSISDEGARQAMKEFRKLAIPPDAIARAIMFAIEQPGEVDVNEIIVRPTASPY